MTTARIGLTGATGQLGGRIARRLADRGVRLRLVLRSPERAPRLPGAEVAQATYADADAVRRSLAGLETVLMVSASEDVDRVRQHRTFIDAAAEAGVRHVVYTSFLGASPEATFLLVRDHAATEEHLEGSGMTWTFLRDSLYADFFVLMAGSDGVIRGPAGAGLVAAVAQDDIADAATAVLLDPGAHERATYDLTGPEALSLATVAETMTRVLGRPFAFRDETLEEAYASRASAGAPDWMVDAWVSTYTAIAAGELARVSGDVERLTGRPATSLAALLETQRA